MGMLYLRMLFKDIIGLPHIKNHLTTTADRRRIPHAQLFVGKSGSGTLPMAIAYAQYILCNNSNGDNLEDNSCNMRFNNRSQPDLHFAFPVANTKEVSKHAVSNHFMAQWRDFVEDSPYADVFDWYKRLEIENKQIVVPGEVLAEGMDFLPGEGTFRDGEHVVSSRIGLNSVSPSRQNA